MDLFDSAFLDLWKALNNHRVRYILVGGFATNFHGYQRYTGDVDLYIEDIRKIGVSSAKHTQNMA